MVSKTIKTRKISIIHHASLLAEIGGMVNVAVHRVIYVRYDMRINPFVGVAVGEIGRILDGRL